MILTPKGWRPVLRLKPGLPAAALERDERIADWRGVTDREQDDRRGILRG